MRERRFGAVVQHLVAGRIERAQFQLQTRLQPDDRDVATDDDRAQLFTGTLALRDGQIAAGELWPEMQGLDARVDWNGARIEAVVERGRTGSIELESAQASWSVDGRARAADRGPGARAARRCAAMAGCASAAGRIHAATA